MIRDVAETDVEAIADVAIASTLFSTEDRPFLTEMVDHQLEVGADQDQRMRVLDDGGRIRGVVYYRAKTAAQGVWDLTMIAVPAADHGNGIGSTLMLHVEAELAAEGARLLLVETSATDAFIATRGFYRGLGFEEAARVRDYWSDGDDLVLFRKDLRA